MKQIKIFLTTAMLAVGATASAQFTNAASKGSKGVVNTDGWGTFYLQWNPSTLQVDVKDADDLSFTGFSIGYNKAFSVSKSSPLFLEAGVALQYSFNSEDEDEDYYCNPTTTYKTNFFSAKIPVSLMYKFDLPNSNVSLVPFVGVDFRFNISGKQKIEYDCDYPDHNYHHSDDEFDLFDKKDMGKNDVWKRFQAGWHIGINAHLGENWLIGVSYGSDFSEIAKKTKVSTTSVTLGYRF